MPVNYVLVKAPIKSDRKKISKYVKVIKSICVDDEEMAKRISDQCSITEADVVAVFQAYESNLKLEFARGNSVRLFNLGMVKPMFKAEYDNDGNMVKDSIRLSKLKLYANEKYIEKAKYYDYKFCGDVDYGDKDLEQRTQNLIEYFSKDNKDITTSKYCVLNNCCRTTAQRDLDKLSSDGVIDRRKIGSTFIYELI